MSTRRMRDITVGDKGGSGSFQGADAGMLQLSRCNSDIGRKNFNLQGRCDEKQADLCGLSIAQPAKAKG